MREDPLVTTWIRLQPVIQIIRETRWSADEWPVVKAELRRALALRARMVRASWWN